MCQHNPLIPTSPLQKTAYSKDPVGAWVWRYISVLQLFAVVCCYWSKYKYIWHRRCSFVFYPTRPWEPLTVLVKLLLLDTISQTINIGSDALQTPVIFHQQVLGKNVPRCFRGCNSFNKTRTLAKNTTVLKTGGPQIPNERAIKMADISTSRK